MDRTKNLILPLNKRVAHLRMTDQWSGTICENLGQWFRRCCLKDFLSGALAVLLFGAAEPFMQF